MKTIATIFMISLGLMPTMKSDINISLLYDKTWVRSYDVTEIVFTALKNNSSNKNDLSNNNWMELMNKYTLIFNKDRTFSWDTHPTCGTNVGAVQGSGKWSYEAKENILTLDYKNTITEGYGKKEKEFYRVINIDKTTLTLLQINKEP